MRWDRTPGPQIRYSLRTASLRNFVRRFTKSTIISTVATLKRKRGGRIASAVTTGKKRKKRLYDEVKTA